MAVERVKLRQVEKYHDDSRLPLSSKAQRSPRFSTRLSPSLSIFFFFKFPTFTYNGERRNEGIKWQSVFASFGDRPWNDTASKYVMMTFGRVISVNSSINHAPMSPREAGSAIGISEIVNRTVAWAVADGWLSVSGIDVLCYFIL